MVLQISTRLTLYTLTELAHTECECVTDNKNTSSMSKEYHCRAEVFFHCNFNIKPIILIRYLRNFVTFPHKIKNMLLTRSYLTVQKENKLTLHCFAIELPFFPVHRKPQLLLVLNILFLFSIPHSRHLTSHLGD